MAIDQRIILVSPLRVLARLTELIPTLDFWGAIWYSLVRITAGFLIGTAAGSTFYHFGASLLPPVKAGTLANFDPVSSVILTALLLGTRFTAADLIGFFFIIGAVFLLNIYQIKKS